MFPPDWDEFGQLFYHNNKNYYIVGLDPTFLYDKSNELYEKRRSIIDGTYSGDISDVLVKEFRARYVFVHLNDHLDFKERLDALLDAFVLRYSDVDSAIYEITPEFVSDENKL